jgi:hypothetical protein
MCSKLDSSDPEVWELNPESVFEGHSQLCHMEWASGKILLLLLLFQSLFPHTQTHTHAHHDGSNLNATNTVELNWIEIGACACKSALEAVTTFRIGT